MSGGWVRSVFFQFGDVGGGVFGVRFEKPRRYERLCMVVLLKINGLPVLDRSCCAVSVASEAETGCSMQFDIYEKTEIWNAFFLFTAVTGQNLSLLAV